jgi:hypothetical protein
MLAKVGLLSGTAEPAAVAVEDEIAVAVGMTKFSPEVVLKTSEV